MPRPLRGATLRVFYVYSIYGLGAPLIRVITRITTKNGRNGWECEFFTCSRLTRCGTDEIKRKNQIRNQESDFGTTRISHSRATRCSELIRVVPNTAQKGQSVVFSPVLVRPDVGQTRSSEKTRFGTHMADPQLIWVILGGIQVSQLLPRTLLCPGRGPVCHW